MIIYLSPLVALVGLTLFLVSTNAKVTEIGKIMFWTGLLAFLFHVSGGHAYRLP